MNVQGMRLPVAALAASALLLVAGCAGPKKEQSLVERGRYLVMAGGCNDCHSPKIFTPAGPIPDTTRLLSGHPEGTKLPEFPASVLGPDKWGAVGSADFTAWAGPWGVSFAYNLTPDMETGIGGWSDELFIQTLRTGKFMGMSRDILPPMPWQPIGQMSDDDLKAMLAYLKSLKPIHNRIPNPIPPPGMPAGHP